MTDIPECKFKFGDKVVVSLSAKYSEDYPETFVISGIDWHPTRNRFVPVDQVNITILPLGDLEGGGFDGFTPDDLRLASDDEVAQNRRI